MSTAARRREAQRQADLLAAIQDRAAQLPDGWTGLPRALQAHQAHARGTACTLLRQSHPTVLAMLGGPALDTLAQMLWRAAPPSDGDLGEWGGALAEMLAVQPDWQAWPHLADCARLDWARHQCERAPDTTLDSDSLARLGDTDPAHLHLQLHPHLHLLQSVWPLADLLAQHQAGSAHADTEALDWPQAHAMARHTVVWRRPWRAEVLALDEATGAWMQALLAPQSLDLDTLLDQANAAFDFTAWLTQALSLGWLWRVSVRPPA